MHACVLPGWAISYVCEVPGGAHPSYAHGYYARDNAFCKAWDPISKDYELFQRWISEHVLSTADFAEFRRSIGGAQ
jgi:glutaconate CoA-transferase, subunit A